MAHANLDALGICSQCENLISLSEYAESEGTEIWKCSHCGSIVDFDSFGFDKPDDGCKKIRWVGPQGKWVTDRPDEHFNIGELSVYVEPMRFAR